VHLGWLTADTVNRLVDGAVVTIGLTIATSVLAIIVGVGAGTLRLSVRRGRRTAAGVLIETFRNIPALIQITFWTFAFPNLFAIDTRRMIFFDNALVNGLSTDSGLSVSYYALAAGFALTLNTGAHLAELFRAGVGTLPREGLETARSLGAGPRQVFWRIMLPGGLRASWTNR